MWKGILNTDIEITTDFFKSGAGSMDVVRYACYMFSEDMIITLILEVYREVWLKF